MPIVCPVRFERTTRDAFAKLDYLVMHHAFAIHTKFGRLCDEIIYKVELAKRLQSSGLTAVIRELPVHVAHEDFTKKYQLDLVVENTAVYDAKTVLALIAAHEAQQMNYQYLVDAEHGKLINFRTEEVESRFVNNPLTPEARRAFKTDLSRWIENDVQSEKLRKTVMALLDDWGGFLELTLYREALIHFLGGEEAVCQLVPLTNNGSPLGQQRFSLLTAETAFRITALPEGTVAYEGHLRALLQLTPFSKFQWINIGRHMVKLVTLTKR